jgi:deoxyribonuclease V
MKALQLHDWQVSPAQAKSIQHDLAGQVSSEDKINKVELIAGVDISMPFGKTSARAAVVILTYPELTLIESQVIEKALNFPYIPGLLSFREAPVILAVCEKLLNIPDLIIVDGQGIAHPRRLGLASHLGILWNKPTIGCAKSRLCGEHLPVETERESFSHLVDKEELIGAVLRTKKNAKPLYVSTGHLISLKTTIQWILRCNKGYRLPEPTRLAHLASGGKLAQ